MDPMWQDQPIMRVVPVMEGFTLHYEVRTATGSTIMRYDNEHNAILWCRENAFEYVVTRRHVDQ